VRCVRLEATLYSFAAPLSARVNAGNDFRVSHSILYVRVSLSQLAVDRIRDSKERERGELDHSVSFDLLYSLSISRSQLAYSVLDEHVCEIFRPSLVSSRCMFATIVTGYS